MYPPPESFTPSVSLDTSDLGSQSVGFDVVGRGLSEPSNLLVRPQTLGPSEVWRSDIVVEKYLVQIRSTASFGRGRYPETQQAEVSCTPEQVSFLLMRRCYCEYR